MQEGAIMEIVKWFIGMLMLLVILAFTIFAINTSSVNTFKQQVSYEIERNGGLTQDAINNLHEYSEEFYGGRFKVGTGPMEPVAFGEKVDYEVKSNVEILFFPIPNAELTFKGSGVSYVR